MEPPPPTSPSENPTSAPEASAALIIAIMVALVSWARWGRDAELSDRGNDHAASQHEDETWIPGPGDVKEAANAIRVEHARDGQAEAEQAATNESGDGA